MFAETSTHGGLIEGPTTGYLGANDPSGLIGEGALVIAQVNQLQSQIDSKADAAQTTAALATKEPNIAEGSLAQSKVTNLVASLGAKALQADLVSGLAGKQALIADGGLGAEQGCQSHQRSGIKGLSSATV